MFADWDFTVVSYVTSHKLRPMYAVTRTLDVIVAEMMYGIFVYIDTLSRGGQALPRSRDYANRPTSTFEYPDMEVRRSWNKVTDVPVYSSTSMSSDGVVCMTRFGTLRLKEPTIDLVCMDELVYMTDRGRVTLVARGHPGIANHAVYEVNVNR
jgi:hypothetical protein